MVDTVTFILLARKHPMIFPSMTPRPETVQSTLGIKNPHKEGFERDPEKWLVDKRDVDGAEGLWRIHSKLYDLSEFVEKHPGGQFWLEVTKGTDITEAFESHHISTTPEGMLKRYYVRDTNAPRNSPYTFEEDGFYRTVKRAAREALKTIPKDTNRTTHLMADSILIGLVVISVLANIFWSYTLGIVAGFFSGFVIITAHNYGHQKDSFRMYYMDFVMFQSRAFRIVHVLSHHMYTNSIADLQAYLTEPLLVYFPQKKSWITKYASALYMPVIVWIPITLTATVVRAITTMMGHRYVQPYEKIDLLPLILPVLMYFSSGQSLLATLGMWQFILAVGSLFFSIIAMTMGHFHPDIFMDGDTPRPKHQMDWGICQLDAVAERVELHGASEFVKLVCFGDHDMHHLFPTLDSSVLRHLYPVVKKVVDEYNLNLRMMYQVPMFMGYLRRAAKEVPNPHPPNLHKKLE